MWTVFYSELVLFLLVLFAAFWIVKAICKKTKARLLLVYPACVLVLAAVFLLSGHGVQYHSVSTAATKIYSSSALLADFDALQDAILQKNPLSFTDPDALEERFQEVRASISSDMTQEEFYRLVNPLVVEVNCGHTNLSVSKALIASRKNKALYLPIPVKVQENALLAAKSDARYGIEAGDQIIQINAYSAEEIRARFYENISHDGDNLAIVNHIASKQFAYVYYEFVEQADHYKLQLQNPQGGIYSVSVDGAYSETHNTGLWQLRMEEYTGIQYYDAQIEGKSARLTVRVFFEDDPKFAAFLQDFFQKLEEQKVETLLIDLRGNYGGSPAMTRELLSYLIAESTTYFSERTKLPLPYRMQGLGKEVQPKDLRFEGQTTLLIDGAVFSSAAHFAAVFRSNQLGTVIGEPSGGGSVCTDGASNLVLRNTGIRLHNSQSYYEVVADEAYQHRVLTDVSSQGEDDLEQQVMKLIE